MVRTKNEAKSIDSLSANLQIEKAAAAAIAQTAISSEIEAGSGERGMGRRMEIGAHTHGNREGGEEIMGVGHQDRGLSTREKHENRAL